MNTLEKMMGEHGCFLIVGAAPADMPEGYAAYCMMVRVDKTEVTEMDVYVDGSADTVDDLSWMSVELLRGDLITFADPVVSITLTGETNSVLCYLMPTDYIAAE